MYPLESFRIDGLLFAEDVGGRLDEEDGVEAGLERQVFEPWTAEIKNFGIPCCKKDSASS
jgi:hypothetical protein